MWILLVTSLRVRRYYLLHIVHLCLKQCYCSCNYYYYCINCTVIIIIIIVHIYIFLCTHVRRFKEWLIRVIFKCDMWLVKGAAAIWRAFHGIVLLYLLSMATKYTVHTTQYLGMTTAPLATTRQTPEYRQVAATPQIYVSCIYYEMLTSNVWKVTSDEVGS